ncbi:MAG: HU family DNA-binding protein [Paludibacteraceae bacterium]|nr:HU family DNA-binding protein [Paludibacteraceae bacterium]
MNNKVTLQDLADQLSAISGQSKKLSEGFLRALTEIVEEALAKDGIAKVKGIGTFKIVAIEERKSVSVTDGSAVIIPAHKKITFTPEKELKEAVNKPYEDLETYVLPSDGPVDGPYIDEDEEEGEGDDMTSSADYTNINPVDTNAVAGSTSVTNTATSTNESTVAQNPAPNIETPQTSQSVSAPSPEEPVTPTYNYASTSNTYTTPSTGNPTVESSITTNSTTESTGVQSPIQASTTPPVSEPTPAPEPTITSTAAPAPEATKVQEVVTETCAPVGPTPTEEIQQTADNTIPGGSTQPATAQTISGGSTTEEGPTTVQNPQGAVEQPIQSDVKEETVQDGATINNEGEVNATTSETTAQTTDAAQTEQPQPTAQTEQAQATAQTEQAQTSAQTEQAQPTAQTEQAQASAQTEQAQPAAAIATEHNGKHRHHKKKKKERNKGLLAVIIILALLIIACLVYALRSDKGFTNGLNDLKGKITGIFSGEQPVPVVVDSTLSAESISKEQAQVDEFFEEKTEDMYEAAQADQEFPTEVEEEQNWDWFEEGVKKFIKKEYPKLNFEVKGEPAYDTIRRGQTLTSMSRKYYNGVKDFWVYIYLYNKDVIRRPDEVSVGTPIKIPQLDETVIDPSSYESINAAKDVKESYLRLFN